MERCERVDVRVIYIVKVAMVCYLIFLAPVFCNFLVKCVFFCPQILDPQMKEQLALVLWWLTGFSCNSVMLTHGTLSERNPVAQGLIEALLTK